MWLHQIECCYPVGGKQRAGYNPNMAKRRTKLPKRLRGQENWDKWEKALAFAAVMPRFFAPSTRERRERIKTLHYLDLLERMVGCESDSAEFIRLHLTNRLERRRRDLISTARLTWYREQLFIEEEAGSLAPSILTTGLIVKILCSERRDGKRQRTIVAAYDHLRDNYKPGIAIRTSEKATEAIWRKWKHAAHLCAAFVDFLPFDRALQINNATLVDLEGRFDEFVATAVYYQSFLTGEAGDGAIPWRTRKQFELATVDALTLTASPFARSDLPLWDRKPGTAG
jgi:hypothetical protein